MRTCDFTKGWTGSFQGCQHRGTEADAVPTVSAETRSLNDDTALSDALTRMMSLLPWYQSCSDTCERREHPPVPGEKWDQSFGTFRLKQGRGAFHRVQLTPGDGWTNPTGVLTQTWTIGCQKLRRTSGNELITTSPAWLSLRKTSVWTDLKVLRSIAYESLPL